MNEIQTKALQSLKLADEEEYFKINIDNVADVQNSFASAVIGSPYDWPPPGANRAGDKRTALLVIKMPAVIDENRHPNIPLLIGTSQTGLRRWQVAYNPNTFSFLTNLETGEMAVRKPFITEERYATPQAGPEPDDINARAISCGVRPQDLREVYAHYAWHPSPYALTVVYYDWVSNTEIFELRSQPNAARPAVPIEKYNELYQKIKAGAPGGGPDVQPGFACSVPDRAEPGKPILINIKLNMTLGETGLVQTIASGGAGEQLPLALLLVKKDNNPVLFNFSIPVEKVKNQQGADYLHAAVTVDVNKGLNDRNISAGDYLVYINVGKNVFGPQPIHIGTE